MLLALSVGCGDAGEALEVDEELPAPPAVLADLSSREFNDGCLAAGCHAQLGGQRWIHGPVAGGGCATCHEVVGDASEHAFAATIEGAELCFSCHSSLELGNYSHEPYAEERCLDCHDPHGGARKSYITTASAAELCEKCHEPRRPAFPHAPVAQGDCLACHDPHSSNKNHLLVLDQGELCLSCHREFSRLLPENIGAGEVSLANAHQALVDGGCLICHQAHGGSNPALLDRPSRELCESCHEEVVKDLPGAKTVHGAFRGEDSCIQCHSPHASLYDHLLKDSPGALCFRCHGEEIAVPGGGQIADIADQLEASKHVHLPVSQGECTACHLAHFSAQRSLLRLEYPDHIYANFDENAYGLCFQCHDESLAEKEHDLDTGFRDGDVNLHYVHVHREKGRACDICHRPHGSGYPNLLRKTFPFGPGRWDMPIDYVELPNGGTCASACHEVKSYDNSLTTSELPRPPRSSKQ